MAKRRTKKSTPKAITKPCSKVFLTAVRELQATMQRELERKVGELIIMELDEQGMDKTQWRVNLERGVWIQRTGD